MKVDHSLTAITMIIKRLILYIYVQLLGFIEFKLVKKENKKKKKKNEGKTPSCALCNVAGGRTDDNFKKKILSKNIFILNVDDFPTSRRASF